MLELYLFATIISLFLALGLNVVISQNPVYSILYLVLFFITGSGILAMFGLDYLALIFVLVYVGAIAVLFLFVVMILDIKIINKSGFDATFLVLISLILFILPVVYHSSVVILLVQKGYSDGVFNMFSGSSAYGPVSSIVNCTTNTIYSLGDKQIYLYSLELYSHLFVVFENYLLDRELLIYQIGGCYDYFLLLKLIFCKHGFIAPEAKVLFYESISPLKIDYDSSVKNFQILYTDFTSLFVICGGVLLIAMTSCISLALPARQFIQDKRIPRRFQI